MGFWLGVLQGITEFLPISSSGHLVILQNLFGIKEPEVLFDASLHLGTLLALLIYFRHDIMNMLLDAIYYIKSHPENRSSVNKKTKGNLNLLLSIILAQIPTATVGLIMEKPAEFFFSSTFGVGLMLIITSIILALSSLVSDSYMRKENISPLSSFVIGTLQGIAVIPGISRSGITIVCGMALGLEKGLCARFSFLISIPAIIGAVCLRLLKEGIHSIEPYPMIAGVLMSFVVGLIALHLMIKMVKRKRLIFFAPYCILIGLLCILTL